MHKCHALRTSTLHERGSIVIYLALGMSMSVLPFPPDRSATRPTDVLGSPRSIVPSMFPLPPFLGDLKSSIPKGYDDNNIITARCNCICDSGDQETVERKYFASDANVTMCRNSWIEQAVYTV